MKIQVKRGSTLRQNLTIFKGREPLDLTSGDFAGSTLIYLLKEQDGDRDDDAVLTFTTTNVEGVQLVILDASLGALELKAPASAMRLPLTQYAGALQITTVEGEIVELPNHENPDVWQVFGDAVHAT